MDTASLPYRYAWPHPAVTADVVLFSIRDGRLVLLLIRRGQAPCEGRWALPGGFVDIDEDLEAAARRELAEEAGVEVAWLEQLYTFGRPDRDPRERIITVAYLALLPAPSVTLRAGSDASDAAWYPVDELPPLAFDHDAIVALARERLASKLGYSDLAVRLLPENFTLSEAQTVYEAVLGRPLDKRNFRRRVTALLGLVPTGETRRDGNHRPARLYRPGPATGPF